MSICKDCIHYEICDEYVSPCESFPEVEGGCMCFKKQTNAELEKTIDLLNKEYERAKLLEYVKNPLAYALYQVWKIADKKRRENGKS